jgi:RNA polymerase sigma-70 factor (ECF subfamily)
MTDPGSGRLSRGEPDVGLRPRMVSIAYRMIGSVSEAEDIVQEAYLRVHRELRAGTQVESEQAYLTTVTTRLAIDHLRSARVRREEYFGPWLPEPLVDEVAPDMAEHADMADSLSMAFLVILETLSPVERAVFLLHDVFDYGYDEIAEIVDKSEPNCRQIAARARRRVDAGKPRFEVSRQRRDGLAEQFFAACGAGDVDGLVGLLAADAAFYGDGGGKGQGFPRPIFGRERVTQAPHGGFPQARRARRPAAPGPRRRSARRAAHGPGTAAGSGLGAGHSRRPGPSDPRRGEPGQARPPRHHVGAVAAVAGASRELRRRSVAPSQRASLSRPCL